MPDLCDLGRYVERLKATRASGTQTRLDAFFRAGAPKAVPDSAKFDPFKRKQPAAGSGKRAGKQPAGPGKRRK